MLVAVVGPVATAGLAVTVAAVIQFHTVFAWILTRFPLVIFLGTVAAIVLLVWAHGLVFGYVDGIVADPEFNAAGATTMFGGQLTLEEIQGRLLTDAERAGGTLPKHGTCSLLAYPLWPIQFRLVRDVFGIAAMIGFVSFVAMFTIWWERKVAGRIQSRLGPMRV